MFFKNYETQTEANIFCSCTRKRKSMRKNGNYILFLELVEKHLVWVNPRREGERDAFWPPLVEWAPGTPQHLQHNLFCLIPSWDTVSLQQPELWWDVRTFQSAQMGTSIPRLRSLQNTAALPLTFPQSTPINTCGKSVHLEKQFLLFWVFVVINLLPTWSHERQGRMQNRSSSGLHCQAQPKENERLHPLVFQPRRSQEPALLGAVDLQSGLQLPQNIRPTVWVLSINLSLFGD